MGFAENLYKLRKQKGLTQQELADKTNIKRSAIGMYEQGKNFPQYEKLIIFADFFGVDMNTLISGSPAPATEPALTQAEKDFLQLFGQLNEIDQEEIAALMHIKLTNKKRTATTTTVTKSA